MNLLMWPALATGGIAATLLMRQLKDQVLLLIPGGIVAGGGVVWLVLAEPEASALLVTAGAGAVAASRIAKRSRSMKWRAVSASAGAVPGLVCFAILGAVLPQATWFGATVSHGPRSANEVALTFDDGPNGEYTLAVMHALDTAGVKATFFEVGKAAEAEPDVTRQLLNDGQLIGNHSYSHGRWDWLVPWYPEAAKAEHALKDVGGVCAAYYRPPHGERSPLTVFAASRNGLTTVTWDVSAADWATNDPNLVASRVLEDVRPGSIILLHDGLDGRPGADRSVVVQALPMILEGLKERGLEPVRLDVLLSRPAYQASC